MAKVSNCQTFCAQARLRGMFSLNCSVLHEAQIRIEAASDESNKRSSSGRGQDEHFDTVEITATMEVGRP